MRVAYDGVQADAGKLIYDSANDLANYFFFCTTFSNSQIFSY